MRAPRPIGPMQRAHAVGWGLKSLAYLQLDLGEAMQRQRLDRAAATMQRIAERRAARELRTARQH